MSGTRSAPGEKPLRLPRGNGAVLPASVWNTAASLIEFADQNTQKKGVEPRLQSFLLQSPDGAAWRVSIGNDGVLVTAPINQAPPL